MFLAVLLIFVAVNAKISSGLSFFWCKMGMTVVVLSNS